jgi:hypothetical protein
MTPSWKEAGSPMEKKPFVEPTLNEEASLTEVTLVSGAAV